VTPSMRVIERLSRVTPVGLRFQDASTDTVVSEGLSVEIYSADRPDRRVKAWPNRRGTFVAPRLGARPDPEFEFGAGDDTFWRDVSAHTYLVEVTDRRDQFQPFIVEVALPARGHAVPLNLPQESPPSTALPLFATPSRLVPAGMAVIRADLRYLAAVGGRMSLQPAAWAVLEARIGRAPLARGIADVNGRIAVVFPYPELADPPIRPASPPFAGGQALVDQEWSVALDAFFEPVAPVPAIPDLSRTLTQAPATLWSDALQHHPLGEQTLRYGRELVLRSEGAEDRSVVIITPSASPP
jgi:hypothetical protein